MPSFTGFVGDTGKRLERERRVGFVFQMLHAPALIVIAREAEERHDRAAAA